MNGDLATRAQLFVYLGDAHWRQTARYTAEVWGPQRRRAAEAYAAGLRELLREDLPAAPPELPAVGRYRIDGDPEAERLAREENERQVAAREEARRLRDLVQLRQVLTGQIVQMYAREPDAFDELRLLAVEHLGGEGAAERLIAAAKGYREDPRMPLPVIDRLGGG